MKYLSNGFSLGMLKEHAKIDIQEFPSKPEGELVGAVSIVGHQTTADLLGVEFNRQTVKLDVGDELYVAQYDGARLPEGARELPDGAKFRWFKISYAP
jgi:hypothetical protein